MYRVGDVFREPPEVRQTVLDMIEEYDAARTLQDIEPAVPYARGHGIPVSSICLTQSVRCENVWRL